MASSVKFALSIGQDVQNVLLYDKIYKVGMTGVPVVNVNNNCSTGSTALFLARQAVEAGMVDCALAVGFEQMRPGALEFIVLETRAVNQREEDVGEMTRVIVVRN